MPTLGCDLSSEYQPNFDIVRAHREGLRFVAVKLSDSLKGTERYEDGIRVIRTARSLGMVAFGYHFMRTGFGVERDADMFAGQLKRAGCPGALDWESTAESVPDIEQLRALTGEVWATGSRLCFTYAPRWYWQGQGSPSLTGLPPLWASRFVTRPGTRTQMTGTPAEIVKSVDPSWWEGYGNRPVRILQFTSVASIAGLAMDADVYQGDIVSLENEVYG